jgi:DNA-binding transcriptional MerR regulator
MPTTQEGPKVSGTPRLLSIGELAERSGVATTALRYYDERGLVRPATRSSGRRRYAESAVAEVGATLFFREVGSSLAEISSFLTARDRRSRQEIVDRKLAELTEQQHPHRGRPRGARARSAMPRRRPHALPAILVDHRRTATRALTGGEPRASALTTPGGRGRPEALRRRMRGRPLATGRGPPARSRGRRCYAFRTSSSTSRSVKPPAGNLAPPLNDRSPRIDSDRHAAGSQTSIVTPVLAASVRLSVSVVLWLSSRKKRFPRPSTSG